MKNATEKKRIAASEFQLTAPCELTFQADPSKDTPDHHPFTGVGYTGAEMPSFAFGKIIVDLSSAKINQRTAILYSHNYDSRIGHTEKVNVADKLELSGVLYSNKPQGAEVIQDSKRGFPWQMSIGIHSATVGIVPKGHSVKVNGQEFAGPGAVLSNAFIGEVSFTTLGRDHRTTAVAASAETDEEIEIEVMTLGENKMDEKELKAKLSAAEDRFQKLESEMTVKLQMAEKRAEEAEKALAEKNKSERVEKAKATFSAIGVELSAEEAEKYAAMDEKTFSAVMEDFKKATPKRDPLLFSEQGRKPENKNGEKGEAVGMAEFTAKKFAGKKGE